MNKKIMLAALAFLIGAQTLPMTSKIKHYLYNGISETKFLLEKMLINKSVPKIVGPMALAYAINTIPNAIATIKFGLNSKGQSNSTTNTAMKNKKKFTNNIKNKSFFLAFRTVAPFCLGMLLDKMLPNKSILGCTVGFFTSMQQLLQITASANK